MSLVIRGTSPSAVSAHVARAAAQRARSQAEYDHAFLIRRDSLAGFNTMGVAMRAYAGTPGTTWTGKSTGYARRINTGRVS